MDIGRIVPMIRHPLGNRHMAANGDLKAVAPVAEVREADDGLLGHAHQAAQDFFRVLHGLNGLAQNNHIKALIAKSHQAFFQIGLNDVYAAGYSGNHTVGIDFNTVAGAVFYVPPTRPTARRRRSPNRVRGCLRVSNRK